MEISGKYRNGGFWLNKPPLHRAATFVPPLSDQKRLSGRLVVAQTQKVMSLCNCCSTILVPSLNHPNCCSGKTGRTKEAKWRQNHCGSRVVVVAEWGHTGCHSGRLKDAISRPKEAQWWCKRGRSSAQIDAQYLQQVFYGATDDRPLCIHCATTPMRVCLRPAFFERPVSDRPPRWPFVTVLNMFKTSRRPWHPWRGLNVLRATFERPWQPSGLLYAFNGDLSQFCGRTREVQRSQSLC